MKRQVTWNRRQLITSCTAAVWTTTGSLQWLCVFTFVSLSLPSEYRPQTIYLHLALPCVAASIFPLTETAAVNLFPHLFSLRSSSSVAVQCSGYCIHSTESPKPRTSHVGCLERLTRTASVTCSVEDTDRRGSPGVVISRYIRKTIDRLRPSVPLPVDERCLASDDRPVPDVSGRHHTNVRDTTCRPCVLDDELTCGRGTIELSWYLVSTVDERHPAASVVNTTVDLNKVWLVYRVTRQTDVDGTSRLCVCNEYVVNT